MNLSRNMVILLVALAAFVGILLFSRRRAAAAVPGETPGGTVADLFSSDTRARLKETLGPTSILRLAKPPPIGPGGSGTGTPGNTMPRPQPAGGPSARDIVRAGGGAVAAAACASQGLAIAAPLCASGGAAVTGAAVTGAKKIGSGTVSLVRKLF